MRLRFPMSMPPEKSSDVPSTLDNQAIKDLLASPIVKAEKEIKVTITPGKRKAQQDGCVPAKKFKANFTDRPTFTQCDPVQGPLQQSSPLSQLASSPQQLPATHSVNIPGITSKSTVALTPVLTEAPPALLAQALPIHVTDYPTKGHTVTFYPGTRVLPVPDKVTMPVTTRSSGEVINELEQEQGEQGFLDPQTGIMGDKGTQPTPPPPPQTMQEMFAQLQASMNQQFAALQADLKNERQLQDTKITKVETAYAEHEKTLNTPDTGLVDQVAAHETLLNKPTSGVVDTCIRLQEAVLGGAKGLKQKVKDLSDTVTTLGNFKDKVTTVTATLSDLETKGTEFNTKLQSVQNSLNHPNKGLDAIENKIRALESRLPEGSENFIIDVRALRSEFTRISDQLQSGNKEVTVNFSVPIGNRWYP